MTTVQEIAPTISPGTRLPARRGDLIVRPSGNDGAHVVKDPRSGEYFRLGPEESFLLRRLDGRSMSADVCTAFERQLRQPLAPEELEQFVEMARGAGWLEDGKDATDATDMTKAPSAKAEDRKPPLAAPTKAPPAGQSILFWRKRIFDPDRLFDRLEPWMRFVWTPAFLLISAAFIGAAAGVVWVDHVALVSRFGGLWGWQALLVAWLTMVIATTCHEFAHGLTCKHYGGEVHEVGFLLLYFTPGFYCNVSDAWLFREKSRRLWVTLAGGYCDLILWAAGVFVWRVTLTDTLPNYIAHVALSVCGMRIFFNFNPLLKLDGYYLLSDVVGIHNLRQRAWDAWTARVRWLLWGAPRPPKEERGRFLLWFGVAAWGYSLAFLALIVAGMMGFAHQWGWLAIATCVLFALAGAKAVSQGITGGEFANMVTKRPGRLATWGIILAIVGAALAWLPVERRVTGPFQVRAATRRQIHAPASGFIREVLVEEGQRVEPGTVLARLDVPNLASLTLQKQAEVAEGEAKLQDCEAALQQADEQLGRTRADYAAAKRRRDWCAADRGQAVARLARAREELNYLRELAQRTTLCSPVRGVLMSAHMNEKPGQYVKEGDLIGEIEEPTSLVAEIKVPEQDVARVAPGLRVEIKARSLPFDTFTGTVDRVAPGASAGDVQSSVTVYCRIDRGATAATDLRPGMTGDARILCERRSLGKALAERVLRVVRTEFWW